MMKRNKKFNLIVYNLQVDISAWRCSYKEIIKVHSQNQTQFFLI